MKNQLILFGAAAAVLTAVVLQLKSEYGGAEKKHENVKTIVAIDFGTSYSRVGVFRNGRVEIIPNEYGNRFTPSYVAFTKEGKRLIGEAAKKQLLSNPENTIFNAKRFLGRAKSDYKIQRDLKQFPFKIVEKNVRPHMNVSISDGAYKAFAAEEIVAMVLWKMKQDAEAYLEKEVTHAVISVPACFNDAQRKATIDAGLIAGLTVEKIINEPTAAAIAYGIDEKKSEKKMLIFNLGGGNVDVSLVNVAKDSGMFFEVKATNGNTHLGGEDFDQSVVDHIITLYKRENLKDIRKNNRAAQKLRREVERAKKTLSTAHQVRIEIESFIDGEKFSKNLTRDRFEEINMGLFRSTLEPVQSVLEDAGLKKKDIDEIVLVGGSTRIPKIQALVREFFNGKKISRSLNPDEAVVFGATLMAGMLSREEGTGDFIVEEVNPFALGVATGGFFMKTLIPRNSRVPRKVFHTFTTSEDNQKTVAIEIYEGDRPMVKDNHHLGQFDLTGIRPAPNGVPEIKVSFYLNHNGILEVSAEETRTGVRDEILITNENNRIKQRDFRRMIEDADRFADVDKKNKDKLKAINDLENYVYLLKEHVIEKIKIGDKFFAEKKEEMENAIDDVIKWIEDNPDLEPDDYKSEKDRLVLRFF